MTPSPQRYADTLSNVQQQCAMAKLVGSSLAVDIARAAIQVWCRCLPGAVTKMQQKDSKISCSYE